MLYANFVDIGIDLGLDDIVQSAEMFIYLVMVIDVEENQHRAELQNENIFYQDSEYWIKTNNPEHGYFCDN